jgi:hypothetical protein
MAIYRAQKRQGRNVTRADLEQERPRRRREAQEIDEAHPKSLKPTLRVYRFE